MIVKVWIGILVPALIALLPAWPYSRRWGWVPASGVALILILLMLLVKFDVV